MKIYGSMLCPDCVACRRDLDLAGIAYDYLDFSDSLLNLKEFLKIRDHDPRFQQIRELGQIGIPCIVRDDGSITLSWDEFLNK